MPNWNGVIACEVLDVEPNKKLSYGFRPDQEANYQGANYGGQKFIAGLERVVAGLN